MRIRLTDVAISFIAIILIVWVMAPVYNMVVTSLLTYEEVWETHLWPPNPTIEPYIEVLTQRYFRVNLFWTWFGNSIKFALLVSLLSLTVSVLYGYAISNKSTLSQKVKNLFNTLSVITYIFPSALLAIPIFILMMYYNLLNTDIAVTLSLSILTIPFNSWMAAQYFNSMPRELKEAAEIDGASTTTYLFRILLPVAAPMLVAIFTYSFMFTWNNYLYPLLLLNEDAKFPLQIGMSSFLAADDSPWNIFMATAIIYALPPVVLYYAFKKYMISGLFRGAVKG